MMKEIGILCVLLLAGGMQAGLGQEVQVDWHRAYGDNRIEAIHDVQATSDGGFIMVGSRGDLEDADVWLVKTDSAGAMLWSRTYGGEDYEDGWGVAQTADGGYVVTGWTESYGAGDKDVWIVKTDASGGALWNRTVGGPGEDRGQAVIRTTTGHLVVAGYTNSFGAGKEDAYVIKLTDTGQILWSRAHGLANTDQVWGLAEAHDGTYVLTGRSASGSVGYVDLLLMKVEQEGGLRWARLFTGGARSAQAGYAVIQAADSGFVMTGFIEPPDSDDRNVVLWKVDRQGDVEWQHAYGGPQDDVGYAVAQGLGGYFVGGSTRSYGAGEDDVWFLHTDAAGEQVGTKTFGGAEKDYGWAGARSADGGFVIAGYTESFGANPLSRNGLLVRLGVPADVRFELTEFYEEGGTGPIEDKKVCEFIGVILEAKDDAGNNVTYNGNVPVYKVVGGTETFLASTDVSAGLGYALIHIREAAEEVRLKAHDAENGIVGYSNTFAVEDRYTLTLSAPEETIAYGETIELTLEIRELNGFLVDEGFARGFRFEEVNAGMGHFDATNDRVSTDAALVYLDYTAPTQEEAGSWPGVQLRVTEEICGGGANQSTLTLPFEGGPPATGVGYDFVRIAGGAGQDAAHAVAVDAGAGKRNAAGRVYVAGSYEDDLTVGALTLPRFDEDDLDVFLAALDEDGQVLWAERAGGGRDDAAIDVAVDGAGHLYVTGAIGGEATFGNTTLDNGQGEDVFLAKYDADGRLLWATESSSTRFACCDQGIALALDNAGNVLLTGHFMEDITFDPITLIGVQNQDLFLVKYDPAGNVQWARKATGSDQAYGTGIGADGDGNVYVGGYFDGDLDVEGTSLLSTGRDDGLLMKFDPAGGLQWVRQLQGTDDVRILDLAVDAEAQVYVTGEFDETVDFGGTTLQTDTRSLFVARYDAGGRLVWVQAPASSSSIGYSLALDAAGRVYVIGETFDDFTLGSVTLPWAGSDDVFTLAFDRDGTVLWGTSAGGEETDRGYAVAVGSQDRCLVVGTFEAQAGFGPHTLQSAGEEDVFLARVRGATTPVGVDAPDRRSATTFFLDQNYPNPFTGRTTIEYTVPDPAFVRLTIYTLLGEEVATLVDERQGAGTYRVPFDATRLSSGVSFYRVQMGGFTEERTLVLVR